MTDEYIALQRAIESVNRTVNIHDEDMGDLLKKMDTIMVRQGKIEEILERVLEHFNRQTKKVRQTVEDVMEPIAEQVSQIQEVVNGGD